MGSCGTYRQEFKREAGQLASQWGVSVAQVALADTIARMAGTVELRTRLGAIGSARVAEEFLALIVAWAYEQLYHEVLAEESP